LNQRQRSWNTGGMYSVELYGRVRRAVLVEGRSQRSVAREFGLARVTVRKMLGYSIPPGYRRKEPAKRPKLGPWIGVIDAILEADKTKPGKQRHTAQRGDWCLLYTDGIPETANPAAVEFGTNRFKQVLEMDESTSADQFADRLLEELSRWSARGSTEDLDDDLTIVAIHVKSNLR